MIQRRAFIALAAAAVGSGFLRTRAARAQRPPSARTPVRVTREPPVVVREEFDPRRPPPDMPALTPPEAGVCRTTFGLDASVNFSAAALSPTTTRIYVEELDIVIASPHVSLKQDSKKATDRLLKAIENPYVHIIGHPTGRLINSRDGLPLDMPRIVQAAKDSATVLEINAGYPRLDLNDVHARGAIEAGVMLSINTDAHSIEGFEEIPMGIMVARRAAATKEHVINCMSLEKLRAFIGKKRR